MSDRAKLDVMIVGGGMITNDLILPSVYHLQRLGVIGRIHVCALNSAPLKALKDSRELQEAFPGQAFEACPSLSEPPDKMFSTLFKEKLATLPPRQAVIVAVPDQFHYDIVKAIMSTLYISSQGSSLWRFPYLASRAGSPMETRAICGPTAGFGMRMVPC